ncbi:B9 domain-containing protein 2 [Clydaea vesicula]|uniref:B9 domain-containing protein 2 n=1 Tax=Clydaea vesicula TaxID=447962 RepID=A0AAD5Y0Y4_9FUNG|nr:B9 domain-containing protein 2 [Clydaea vesicula]
MAELHIVGTLIGASQFPASELCCEDWKLLEGFESAQTQVDIPAEDSNITLWDHPIDVHYSTNSIEGWPKMQFQVYHQDSFGRNELYGYGVCYVPTIPGTHEIDCVTWRPVGSFTDQLWSFFLNATPQLKNLDIIHNPTDRYQLTTESMGKIHLEITVICRNFQNYGVCLSTKQ